MLQIESLAPFPWQKLSCISSEWIVLLHCTLNFFQKNPDCPSSLPATKCYSKLVCAHVRGGCEMIFQARIKCFISPLRRSHNCKLFNISLIMFLLSHIYAFNKFKILSLPGMYEPNATLDFVTPWPCCVQQTRTHASLCIRKRAHLHFFGF